MASAASRYGCSSSLTETCPLTHPATMMKKLLIGVLTLVAISVSSGPSVAQQEKTGGEKRPAAAAETTGASSSAARASCDAKCRQDNQGNQAAMDACLRGCGAGGSARSTTVKSSKSNSSE